MKKIFIFLISFCLFLGSTTHSLAIYDPASVANNKFGIHIFNENDLTSASNLVNSQGGDWGYVTVVIAQNERNHDRWQKAFDQMRRLHLIPIVRIATAGKGDTWEIPKEEEIDSWVSFLNSLNWVIKNRYVVLFNEPNHAQEWGGQIDPSGYAKYIKTFSQKLKNNSDDFYILPAGLDASSKNTGSSMEESRFIKGMLTAEPDLFNYIDGWTSHSYPNPDFSGNPSDRSKGTVSTFEWELNYLKSLGVNKDLPVFITETGWSNKALTESQIGSYLKIAYQNVWNNPKIVAVTPFILNYTEPPFNQFSWKKSDGSFYQFYSDIQKLEKTAGEPVQIESGQILAAFAQPIAFLSSDFGGAILAKNTGQTIWNFNDVSIGSENGKPFIKSYSFNDLEPNNIGLLIFKAQSPDYAGIYSSALFLKGKNAQRITNSFAIESVITKWDFNQVTVFLKSLVNPINLKF